MVKGGELLLDPEPERTAREQELDLIEKALYDGAGVQIPVLDDFMSSEFNSAKFPLDESQYDTTNRGWDKIDANGDPLTEGQGVKNELTGWYGYIHEFEPQPHNWTDCSPSSRLQGPSPGWVSWLFKPMTSFPSTYPSRSQ